MQKAFTLIELLVVVLIIGILSAVALPQYKNAVTKSKAMQAIISGKALATGAQSYRLANGKWPSAIADIADIEVKSTCSSWTNNTGETNEELVIVCNVDGVNYFRGEFQQNKNTFQIFCMASSTETAQLQTCKSLSGLAEKTKEINGTGGFKYSLFLLN